MQKPLAELITLPPPTLSELLRGIEEPLRITDQGEPRFVVQSLATFERMIRRLRRLEAERELQAQAWMAETHVRTALPANVIPLHRHPSFTG